MRKSIKQVVFIRVIAALMSILLFSGVTTFNLLRIKGMQENNMQTSALLSQIQSAETAHYKWSGNLSKALYAGGEFPGTDDTQCVLGQWIYGEVGTDDPELLSLRDEIKPMHKQLHQSVAEVQKMMGTNPTQAQEYYQKAIDLSPGSARCWRLMGKFLANVRKDQDKALPFLKKSVELMPDSTYGFMKLGEVYEALGQKEEAVVCYEKALENYRADIEKDPGDCCNYEGTADVLIHLGRFDEAEEMIQKAMSLEKKVFTCSCPFCYEALEDMAKIEERKGNLEKALEWMEQAGRLASTDYYPKEIARLKAAIGDQ